MFQTNSPYKLQAFETLSGFIVRLKCNILNIIYEHRRGYESLQFIWTIRLKYKNMVLLVPILKIYCNCVYNYTLSSIQCIQLYTIQYPVYTTIHYPVSSVYNYTLSSIQCIQLYTIQYPVYTTIHYPVSSVYNYTLSSIQCIQLYTIQYPVYTTIQSSVSSVSTVYYTVYSG